VLFKKTSICGLQQELLTIKQTSFKIFLSPNVPILTAESFYTFQCGAHSEAALFKKI
jgi:hypothetical protein